MVFAYYRITRRVIPERTLEFVDPAYGDDNLRKIASELGVEYISARDVLCDAKGCVARQGSSLMAGDAVHLTATGADYLVRAIAPSIGINVSRNVVGR